MTKSRLRVWAIVCIIAILLSFAQKHIGGVKTWLHNMWISLDTQDVTLNVSFDDADSFLKNNFINADGYRYELDNKFKVNVNLKYVSMSEGTKPDIIIKKADSKAENKTGYTYYHNMFYSPIACYTSSAYLNSDDWNGYDEANNNYFIDMSQVFEGLLADKKWKDIGVKEGMKGDITVKIPNKKSEYYDAVIEFIKNNMESEGLTEAQKDEKVQNIVSRCEPFNISKWADNQETLANNEVVIAPEFYYTDVSSSVLIAYGDKTNAMFYDVWLLNKVDTLKDNDGNKHKFDHTKDVLELYRSRYDFLRYMGLRVKNYTYDFCRDLYSKHLNEYVKIVNES